MPLFHHSLSSVKYDYLIWLIRCLNKTRTQCVPLSYTPSLRKRRIFLFTMFGTFFEQNIRVLAKEIDFSYFIYTPCAWIPFAVVWEISKYYFPHQITKKDRLMADKREKNVLFDFRADTEKKWETLAMIRESLRWIRQTKYEMAIVKVAVNNLDKHSPLFVPLQAPFYGLMLSTIK